MFLSAYPCVSLHAMKKGRLVPAAIHRSDIRRRTESFRPPDDRTYSAEVTSVRSNLLLHRICAHFMLFARPYILIHQATNVKHYLAIFHKFFHGNLCDSNISFFQLSQGLAPTFSLYHIYIIMYISPLFFPCQPPSFVLYSWQ